ncbi:MAG: hypothetical protein R3C99_13205 [Pirellulaceae bacterium]
MPLVDMTRQCFASNPDVIVLYTGHNEFYGVGGVCTNANISDLGIRCRKTRLGQILGDNLFQGAAPLAQPGSSENLLAALPQRVRVSGDSRLLGEAETQFRTHLRRIIGLCNDRGIPLIVCTPASNLRHQSPISMPGDPRKLRTIGRTLSSATSNDVSKAIAKELEALTRAHPRNAAAQYRLAQSLEQSEQYRQAISAYSLARDLDCCRYRAPSSHSRIIKEECQRSKSMTFVCDIEKAFFEASGNFAPGEELFLEHVHFTMAGHWLAANTIAQTIVESVMHAEWRESDLPTVSERDKWLGILLEDELVAYRLAYFVTKSAPFNDAIDADLHAVRLEHCYDSLIASLPQRELEIFNSLSPGEKMDDLVDSIARSYMDTGDTERACQLFEKSIRRRPWMPNGYVFAAACRHRAHDDVEANRLLQLSDSTVIPKSARLIEVENKFRRDVEH